MEAKRLVSWALGVIAVGASSVGCAGGDTAGMDDYGMSEAALQQSAGLNPGFGDLLVTLPGRPVCDDNLCCEDRGGVVSCGCIEFPGAVLSTCNLSEPCGAAGGRVVFGGECVFPNESALRNQILATTKELGLAKLQRAARTTERPTLGESLAAQGAIVKLVPELPISLLPDIDDSVVRAKICGVLSCLCTGAGDCRDLTVNDGCCGRNEVICTDDSCACRSNNTCGEDGNPKKDEE